MALGGVESLGASERTRAAAIRIPSVRDEFLAGRIAQRALAAERLGVGPERLTAVYACPDCGTGPDVDHGRPGYWLDGAPSGLRISLSRSGGWAVLAATADPGTAAVGVDLEHVSGVAFPGFDSVALTVGEQRTVEGLAPEDRDSWRARAWARKESILKARGTGLRVDPSALEGAATAGVELRDLDVACLGLPTGYVAALAVIAAAGPSGSRRP
ncbi:4'-phosphopantetheinyl transferase family protein [Arthrobacter sp. 92]|uniref:4'-phosphopantetheinyl transferase family protein n=1 Tax=Arthrobacter sp. 92 TaxID=3418175 RepID=UPI003D04357F